MANGKVLTGFSRPWIALYAASQGEVTYSGGIPLARGVSVQLSVEGANDTNFYADNVLAETDNQAFSSGTASVTVDGLKEAARRLISGVSATKSVTPTGASAAVELDVYDDRAVVPYVGLGFVARYMEDGVTTYRPIILKKIKFSPEGLDAATQEENIDFQTLQLEATIYRDDTSTHEWKLIGADQTSEEDAYAVIQAVLTPAAAANASVNSGTRSGKG